MTRPRPDREDTTAQRERLHVAAGVLRAALDDLQMFTRAASRALRRVAWADSGTEDLGAALAEVHGAASAVRRAEESYDLACLDLATTLGEDA